MTWSLGALFSLACRLGGLEDSCARLALVMFNKFLSSFELGLLLSGLLVWDQRPNYFVSSTEEEVLATQYC